MSNSLSLGGPRFPHPIAQRTFRWFLRTSSGLPGLLPAVAMMVIALVLAQSALRPASGQAPGPAAPWSPHIRTVDEALARRDISTAVRAWHDAYVTALRSRRWEGLVEVGDVYLRIGDVSGFRKQSEEKARRLYVAALFRARDVASLDGVLRVADAFLTLGDREVVYQALRIAESLADRSRDAGARARVRAFDARLRPALPGAERPAFMGQAFPP